MDVKNFYREIGSLSSITASDAREFSEALGIKSVLDYMETGKIEIPLIGSLTIKHVKDTFVEGGVRAVLETTFEPDPFLLKSIGQHADGQQTEAEKLYMQKIQRLLRLVLKE